MDDRRSSVRLKNDERLRLIIQATIDILETNPTGSLTLTKIIEKSELPRSTFLALIPNMATLMAYLHIEAVNRYIGLVNKSSSFVGTGREHFYRAYTAGLLYLKLEPTLSKFVYENMGSVFYTEADPAALKIAKQRSQSLIQIVYDAIEYSILHNEINLPPRISSHILATYLMSAHIGICQACLANNVDMFTELVKYKYYIRQVIDKLPWHPLSTEIDYNDVLMRIVKQYYLEEYMKVGDLGDVNLD